MKLKLWQIDAFAAKVLEGNPAAVVPLDSWLDAGLMRAIANENNLAETAFFVREAEGRYALRWFTPESEVDLCGHATLGSAHVIFQELNEPGDLLRFMTRSGELRVKRDGDLLSLDFPARPPVPVTPCAGLLEALGGNPVEVLAARDYLVRYQSQADVLALKPDMAALMKIDRFAVIVTAPGDDVDFVSRFFAPAKGVPEDPVTGSAHTTLIPYWAAKLGKNELRACQVSTRSGDLRCRLNGERVDIAGRSALFLRGEITI